MLKLNTKCD